MKATKLLLLATTLFLTLATSCSDDESETTIATYTLSTIPIDGNTINGNTWCITDKEASYDDFATLRESLSSISSSSRKITLSFPNLASLYQGALSDLKWEDVINDGLDDDTYHTYKNSIHDSGTSLDALVAVEMEVATKIGDHAFHSCKSLATVTLNGATTIGKEVFKNCISLSTITMPTATTIAEDAFVGCNTLKTISFPNIKTVGTGAFQGCSKLKEVTLASTTEIYDNAFEGCSSLATLSLPSIQSLKSLAFSSCTSLTVVELPAATTLESGAFKGCTSLYSITLPYASNVGMMALSGCSKLAYLTIATETDVVEINSSILGFDTPSNIILTTGKDNNTTVSGYYWSVPCENSGTAKLGAFSQIITK